MKGKLGDKARLEHILESVRLIRKFVEGATFEDFSNNEMLFSACVRHLAIIGEAATNLTSELRANHPEVTWSQIVGMRNILVHRYFGTSEKVLWLTIEQDLPTFEKQVEAILQELT
jgi:uncharacterized protein with HEPN domain